MTTINFSETVKDDYAMELEQAWCLVTSYEMITTKDKQFF